MKPIRTLSTAGMLVLLLFAPVRSANAEIVILENGNQISWDETYYDFRDAEGVQMIKIWIPPGVDPVRGVFISGHGGGGGDSRNFARDENLRAFAMRLGFAVAGLHHFPGRRVYEQGAPVFFRALDHFSGMGHHPELANLPFVMYGSSNGGAATYGFVNYAPERAICFVANVSAGGRPEVPVEEALDVPGVFIMGKFDALIGQRGIDRTERLVSEARSRGALWSWALELKGHEDGYSFDIYMKLVKQAVKLRYPESLDPSTGKVELVSIKESDGVMSSGEIPSLLDEEGYFYPTVEEVAMHAVPEEVAKEARAQIDRAIGFGINPTHIDTHMGSVAATPELTGIYLKLGK